MPVKSQGRAFSEEERINGVGIRYYRRYLDAFDQTGHPIVIRIPRSMALYLLDGADKHERLEKSSADHPLLTYAKRSEVWRAVGGAANAASSG